MAGPPTLSPSFVPAAIAAGAAIGGTALTNSANASEAQKNRDFQERLSSTSYQRARDDMVAAGINPAQMANLGGASTPGGAVAQMQNPLEGAANSALSAFQQSQAMKIAKQQAEADFAVKTAQATTIRTQSGLNIAQNRKAYAEEKAAQRSADLLEAQTKRLKAMQPGELAQQSLNNVLTGLGIPAASNAAAIEQYLGPKGRAMVNSLTGLAGSVKGVTALGGTAAKVGGAAAKAAAAAVAPSPTIKIPKKR
ncbi:MAG: DNA pilot protein [Microvirus sp.]|nr:MAG: DNA pilot protein [Microvirus sp.]